jgi:hypothetical protein
MLQHFRRNLAAFTVDYYGVIKSRQFILKPDIQYRSDDLRDATDIFRHIDSFLSLFSKSLYK